MSEVDLYRFQGLDKYNKNTTIAEVVIHRKTKNINNIHFVISY
ncbi:hypothetical protein B4119_4269 [Parageobacillus caldoxylosilyticus]|uniref:Uncharacterized protein n=1 Tax=Saccharococcus caldoxylosilyticus TaxID=81408 RepID=A0A150LCJ6_9BACL|nr:hypothetical protein B4119_4269 [Parageobacillus caldoxylosilyticus]BDG35789.1 hypothetical protein PcaKH15_16950 [Parageobacillus caldoxylosilyticus]BDG39571.1 hypothetical protein PcaKH16_17100 [Parageobacillus caldoxylosilyticus]BDG43345.1 hypothetical protein PcaKH35_16900 [Parageobacillus caldoxylosilyticus]